MQTNILKQNASHLGMKPLVGNNKVKTLATLEKQRKSKLLSHTPDTIDSRYVFNNKHSR